MRIVIAGDYCSHDRVASIIESGKEQSIIVTNEVKSIIKTADYSIVNFECPIADDTCIPIEKTGPNLKTHPGAIGLIKASGFNAVTLANNHFRDYGDAGVRQTIQCLEEANIRYVGGGRNIDEASKPLLVEVDGYKIAIINCCEREFSIASQSQGGSNPLDPIAFSYEIKELKKRVDRVIVIVHGGYEHYQYPTPRMVKTYRFFVDCGADAVINHHQHCFSGVEIYNSRPIFYGLGNFCFDWNRKRHSKWNTGYLVALELDKTSVSYELFPYSQCDDEPIVKLLENEALNRFWGEIDRINEVINNSSLLEEYNNRFIKETSEGYKLALEPYTGRVSRKLYSMGLLPSFCKGKRKVLLKNLLRCESHYERLLASLEE